MLAVSLTKFDDPGVVSSVQHVRVSARLLATDGSKQREIPTHAFSVPVYARALPSPGEWNVFDESVLRDELGGGSPQAVLPDGHQVPAGVTVEAVVVGHE